MVITNPLKGFYFFVGQRSKTPPFRLKKMIHLGQTEEWNRKVADLAMRRVSVKVLLDFYLQLGEAAVGFGWMDGWFDI